MGFTVMFLQLRTWKYILRNEVTTYLCLMLCCSCSRVAALSRSNLLSARRPISSPPLTFPQLFGSPAHPQRWRQESQAGQQSYQGVRHGGHVPATRPEHPYATPLRQLPQRGLLSQQQEQHWQHQQSGVL